MPNRDLNLEREWKLKFEERKKSGLSVKAWCDKNGIKPTTFHYWIKRFKTLDKSESKADPQFAKVTLQSEFSNKVTNDNYVCENDNVQKQSQIQYSDFQVYFSNFRLTVPSDFSPVALTGLIKILQTL